MPSAEASKFAPLPPMQTLPEPVVDVNVPLGEPQKDTLTMIQMAPDFKVKLRQGYLEDPHWKHTLDVVKKNALLPSQDQANLSFYIKDGLVWNRTKVFINSNNFDILP